MAYDPLDHSQPFGLEDYDGYVTEGIDVDTGSYHPHGGNRETGAATLEEILGASQISAGSALGWRTEPRWYVPRRRRPFSYLWVMLAGRCNFELADAAEPVSAGPGDGVVVPDMVPHSVRPKDGERLEVLVFHFQFRYLGAMDVNSLVGLSGPMECRPAAFTTVAVELCSAYARRAPGWRSLIAGGLAYLLYPALRSKAGVIDAAAGKIDLQAFRKLLPAFSAIHSRYADPSLRVSEVAEEAGMSEVYLRRLFSRLLGKSPQTFIRDERLRIARELLLHSDKTVERIALQTGFDTTSYFYRAFRNRYGTSPGRYRTRPRV